MPRLKEYQEALREVNEWLLAGEGIDLCYHIDDEEVKAKVRALLDDDHTKLDGP